MLPTFTATERLGRFVSDEAQRLSDADRILARHGFGITDSYSDAAYALNRRILDLFDAAIAILEAAEGIDLDLLAGGDPNPYA